MKTKIKNPIKSKLNTIEKCLTVIMIRYFKEGESRNIK